MGPQLILRRAAVGAMGTLLAWRGFQWQAESATTPHTLTLNAGTQMPTLGFGTYLMTGEECQEAVLSALRAGYRLIDTAQGYLNEVQVGEAIEASGLPREEIFLTSKLWCDSHGTEATRRAIKNTLRRLRTSYLDLYLIHAPDNQGASAEEVVELRRQSWLVMEEEHRKGTLRAIGVSNFEPRHIEQVLRWGSVTPAVNQIECHPYLQQRELTQYCEARGIAVAAYGSVGADGLLADPVVVKMAASHGRSPAQICLRHALQRGQVALVKSATPSRIRENARVFDFELTQLEMDHLRRLERGERTYWDNSDVP